jgi:hypothetical protein
VKAASYWVRFKDHVGPDDKATLIMVLSRSARRLTEKSTDREYEVELKRPDRADRFETALNRWEIRGTIEWGRAENPADGLKGLRA